jgi:nucleotide-binding universal stress UspA family protein
MYLNPTMKAPTAILCPIDFSEPSRGALRYAAAIATHLSAPLTLLTVNDPLLEQAADMAGGTGSLRAAAETEIERFFTDTFIGRPPSARAEFAVATGKPDAEILRVAQETGAGVIVMSSRGATGIRKLFLGSITERVLRATNVPVLVTPPGTAGPATLDDVRKTVRRILVPVDLSDVMEHPVLTAREIGEILSAQLIVAHVIEPVRAMVPGHVYAANVDGERRSRAEQRLQELVDALPATPRLEPLVMFGDPAEEIAKIAGDRQAALIVMGLHASAVSGARMGSVTYRVLSVTHGLVLALPPAHG